MKSRLNIDLPEIYRKAVADAINRQINELQNNWLKEIDSVILYALHEKYGFGKKRLEEYYAYVVEINRELIRKYQTNDTPFVCKTKLRDIGVDIDELQVKYLGGNA